MVEYDRNRVLQAAFKLQKVAQSAPPGSVDVKDMVKLALEEMGAKGWDVNYAWMSTSGEIKGSLVFPKGAQNSVLVRDKLKAKLVGQNMKGVSVTSCSFILSTY